MSISILDAVKTSLRITADDFDDDLNDLIDACKLDMARAGVVETDPENKLTRQAIKLFCRANFENGNVSERELYQKRYEKLADAMALCSTYASEVGE